MLILQSLEEEQIKTQAKSKEKNESNGLIAIT